MTIRHFQIFKAVCDFEGITVAADRLNITQPSVSIAIKELEAFYNTKLFDRINRKIYLTEEGALLRQYVENLLEQYEEAELILRKGKTFSKCRLGVNICFAESRLASLLSAIEKDLPDCALTVSVQNSETLSHMLSDNRIDFAIYDGAPDRSTKNTELLFEEEMLLFSAPSLCQKRELSVEALAEQPLLLREEGSGARHAVNRLFLTKGLSPKIAVESASTMNLIDLCRCGLGFLFLPSSLREEVTKDGRLIQLPLTDGAAHRAYYLAQNEHKHLTKTMQRLKDLICHAK